MANAINDRPIVHNLNTRDIVTAAGVTSSIVLALMTINGSCWLYREYQATGTISWECCLTLVLALVSIVTLILSCYFEKRDRGLHRD